MSIGAKKAIAAKSNSNTNNRDSNQNDHERRGLRLVAGLAASAGDWPAGGRLTFCCFFIKAALLHAVAHAARLSELYAAVARAT
jgi:hypothetical protein